MRWKHSNDQSQARLMLLGSAIMAATSVGLVLMTLFVWYPRTVS